MMRFILILVVSIIMLSPAESWAAGECGYNNFSALGNKERFFLAVVFTITALFFILKKYGEYKFKALTYCFWIFAIVVSGSFIKEIPNSKRGIEFYIENSKSCKTILERFESGDSSIHIIDRMVYKFLYKGEIENEPKKDATNSELEEKILNN